MHGAFARTAINMSAEWSSCEPQATPCFVGFKPSSALELGVVSHGDGFGRLTAQTLQARPRPSTRLSDLFSPLAGHSTNYRYVTLSNAPLTQLVTADPDVAVALQSPAHVASRLSGASCPKLHNM